MSHSLLQKRLQNICERALAEKNIELFLKTMKYELYRLIMEHEVLRSEWTHRIQYYLVLSQRADYQTLLQAIHNNFIHLHDALIREKFESIDSRFTNYMKKAVTEEKDEITPLELYDALILPEQWLCLGENKKFTIGDSIYTPWKNVLGQYRIVFYLMSDAWKAHAIKDQNTFMTLHESLSSLIYHLNSMLEEPMYRLHITAFESIDTIFNQPIEWSISELQSYQKDLNVVYRELMFFLEECSSRSTKKTGRQKKIEYLGNGQLKYGDEKKMMAKNTIYANVSQKIYEHCRVVGSTIAVEQLYKECTGREYSTAQWKWLSDNIKSANRWAKRQGLPSLFQCDTKVVTRL